MKTRYRNTAFLAEVLVNILVFSISCAILVGAFSKASILVRQTREESLATVEVHALLETMKLRGEEGLPGAETQPDGSLLLHYDANWQPAQDGTGLFTVHITVENEPRTGGVLQHVTAVALRQDGEEICQFETAFYHPAQGGAAT